MHKVIGVALLLAACGGGGAPMRQLAGGFVLDGAVECGPGTCLGCCYGQTCLEGNIDLACGYGGRACASCEATHACEAPGVCMPALPSADAGGRAPTQPASDSGVDPLTLEERRRRCIPFLAGLFCT
jgi:hypothetical protein